MRPIELAAARYRLGRVSGESLVALAEQLLGEGHNEAVKLAIAEDLDPVTWQVGPLFEDLCSQLGQPIPDPHDAADIVATAILRDIVDGSLAPEAGLTQLMDDVYWPHVSDEDESGIGHCVGESHGLQHLIGAYWSYDDLRQRPTELSIDGRFGEAAIALLDENVEAFARDWLDGH
jgi:hypothetical protein